MAGTDKSIPTGRVRRTAKVTSVIGSQGARMAGTAARNVARSRDRGVEEMEKRHIEALPTDIPERIEVDVSGMEAAAVMHLSEISPPEGVVFLDDPEETIIATINVPTEEPEGPEVEEEAELVGEEGEVPEGEEAPEAEEGAEAPAEGQAAGESGGEES